MDTAGNAALAGTLFAPLDIVCLREHFNYAEEDRPQSSQLQGDRCPLTKLTARDSAVLVWEGGGAAGRGQEGIRTPECASPCTWAAAPACLPVSRTSLCPAHQRPETLTHTALAPPRPFLSLADGTHCLGQPHAFLKQHWTRSRCRSTCSGGSGTFSDMLQGEPAGGLSEEKRLA